MTEFQNLFEAFDAHWLDETTSVCEIQTTRADNDRVNPNLLRIRDYIFSMADSFNETQKTVKFNRFQWCSDGRHDEGYESNVSPTDDQILNSQFYVFGLRIGSSNPNYKVAVICHLDTVPAEPDGTWVPFSPTEESRPYPGGTVDPQQFLVGRGCVDDKGPAMSSFLAARCFAKSLDGSDELANIQIEFLFDSSEETNMSTPIYIDDDPEKVQVPDFGVVYDAFWIVRAEKGGEGPTFFVEPSKRKSSTSKTASLSVESLITTPPISTNTIADWAEATISGDPSPLAAFADSVDDEYANFKFDDPDYRRAEMVSQLSSDGSSLTLRTLVAGAQHGSAPDQNRKEGANPLVSLANFLAGLVRAGKFSPSPSASIACFITDTWGTHVFGEGNPDLYKFDDIFQEGNGTTYAITKTTMDVEGHPSGSIQLDIDIRYSIGHHDCEWDGTQPEGFLPGDKSIFGDVFDNIVDKFNQNNPDLLPVNVKTFTRFPPDIRFPDINEHFQRVQGAFESVMGYSAPHLAIGGGTDAKGYTFMVGIGPLFDTNMGYPINYHGVGEGAPVEDMKKSTQILYTVLEKEVKENQGRKSNPEIRKEVRACLSRIRKMSKKGFKYTCIH